jgi:class 3 adenylate cyclase
VIPLDAGRYFAAHIPGAVLRELPGEDHFVFLGDADRVVAEVAELVTGARTERDPDRALATILFTDIVDSTRRAVELGDRAWRDLLDQHDTLAARAIASQRGRLVKSTGDGILAAFDGPARAARCALALAAEVRALGLEIRAGLHTGEVQLRGADVGGVTVHIAARVQAHAAAGTVLCSSTVRDLLPGSGLGVHPAGTHALKGVPGEWPLFEVVLTAPR